MVPTSSFGSPGVRFLSFWEVVWEIWILMIFEGRKNRRKIEKSRRKREKSDCAGRVGGRGGPSRGFQQELARVCKSIWDALPQGAADLKASPHAADPKISKIQSQKVNQNCQDGVKREPTRAKVPSRHSCGTCWKGIEKGLQKEPTRYPKQWNWNQKRGQNEPRNPQRHPCGTGSCKVFKKGAKRRKPVFPKTR